MNNVVLEILFMKFNSFCLFFYLVYEINIQLELYRPKMFSTMIGNGVRVLG